MTLSSDPPEGFVRSSERGPFTTHNGPFFYRSVDWGAEQAFFAEARHCNSVGLIHGGMLSAFLDGLLAAAVALKTGTIPVTIHLSVDFLGMGRAGVWVLGECAGDQGHYGTRVRRRPSQRQGTRSCPRHGGVQTYAANRQDRLIVATRHPAWQDPLRSIDGGVAQPGSASALGAEGRRFESCRPDHRT